MPDLFTGDLAYIVSEFAETTPGRLTICTAVWLGFLKVLFPGA